MSASERAHCVLPQLWIGPDSLCLTATIQYMFTISVEGPCHQLCSRFPFVGKGVVDVELLDLFTQVFKEEYLEKHRAVYVHCTTGDDQAPFALAYALHKTMFPNRLFEKVYSFVKQQRPSAVDRSAWLEELKMEDKEVVVPAEPDTTVENGTRKIEIKGGCMGLTVTTPEGEIVHHADPVGPGQ